MSHRIVRRSLAPVAAAFSVAASAQEPPAHGHGQPAASAAVTIPASVKVEHDAIHAALERATRAPGAVGEAARSLAQVLHPHFVREEQIALPPLGALAPLARGEKLSAGDRTTLLAMTDSLRGELPAMLAEHAKIHAAVERLLAAARAAGDRDAQSLAEDLSLHARNEEEVMYPAALLVGEMVRGRP